MAALSKPFPIFDLPGELRILTYNSMILAPSNELYHECWATKVDILQGKIQYHLLYKKDPHMKQKQDLYRSLI